METFIGVDPGGSGAITFWTPRRRALIVRDLPSIVVTRGKKNVTEIDVVAFCHLIQSLLKSVEGDGSFVAVALIEEVGIRPGIAAGAVMTTGINWGRVEAVLRAEMLPLERIMPNVWKRDMGCKTAPGANLKAIKDASRHRASQLMPDHQETWKRAMDHNRAEAVLIALYAERLHRQRMAVKS